tara:strand:+ start:333 stop:452 length:120 start_codon:yes stop_codon:yes gene_type:complete
MTPDGEEVIFDAQKSSQKLGIWYGERKEKEIEGTIFYDL